MREFSRHAWMFFLFMFCVLLLWVSVGPLFREVTVNILNKLKLHTEAEYVNSA